MLFLEYYNNTILKLELMNKFRYNKIEKIPKLKKIILNFGCKNSDFKQLTKNLIALELITGKKSYFTCSKKFNISLRIKKGNPVGCKVILRKNQMHLFLIKILFEIFPKLKNLHHIKLKSKTINGISYVITNVLVFSEYEKNYHLFNNLPKLQITFVANSQSQLELKYILNSLKIPIKNVQANVTQMVECNLAKVNVESSNLFFCFWICGREV